MSISSVSGMSTLASYASIKNAQKTQASAVTDKIFEKLDTNQQGFIDKSELQAALTSSSKNDSASSNTDAVFSTMDADGDGKITKQELGNTLQSLMDKMDNLVASMRVRGNEKGNKQADEGFTKDQLVQMAKDSSESDSKRSQFMSKIADNFDKADANGDGKVNREEAISFMKSTEQNQSSQAAGGPQGAGGLPPPGSPPPGGGAGGGGSQESTASKSTDPADTNGDGKVSAKEAVDYLLAQLAASETSKSEDSSAKESSSSTAKPSFSNHTARQILQLVNTYGGSAANDGSSSAPESLSVSA